MGCSSQVGRRFLGNPKQRLADFARCAGDWKSTYCRDRLMKGGVTDVVEDRTARPSRGSANENMAEGIAAGGLQRHKRSANKDFNTKKRLG